MPPIRNAANNVASVAARIERLISSIERQGYVEVEVDLRGTLLQNLAGEKITLKVKLPPKK
jgi:hypothetical protein